MSRSDKKSIEMLEEQAVSTDSSSAEECSDRETNVKVQMNFNITLIMIEV